MFGRFGDKGELWFEVELVAATGERFNDKIELN